MAQGFNITFEVAGVQQLNRTLGVMASNVQDLTGVWDDLRDDFLQGEAEQFDSEGGAASGGWEALSPAYAAWKEMAAPGRPILMLTGRLRASLTNANDPFFVYRPSRLSMEIGTRDPKASFHQQGTGRMPARPPVELTERQKKLWPKMIHEYLFKSAQALQGGPGDGRFTV